MATICVKCKWHRRNGVNDPHLCATQAVVDQITGDELGLLLCGDKRGSWRPETDCPDYEAKDANADGTGCTATDD